MPAIHRNDLSVLVQVDTRTPEAVAIIVVDRDGPENANPAIAVREVGAIVDAITGADANTLGSPGLGVARRPRSVPGLLPIDRDRPRRNAILEPPDQRTENTDVAAISL